MTPSPLGTEPSPLQRLPGWAGFMLVFLVLSLGDFMSISQISPTISYNYLNSSLLYMAAGLLLLYAARFAQIANASRFPAWLLPGLAGFLGGFDVFVKFSASIPFLVLGSIFLAVSAKRWQPVLQLTLGFGLGVATFFMFIFPLDAWYAAFTESLASQTQSTHNPFKVIARQIQDFRHLGTYFSQFFLLPILLLYGLSRRFLRQGSWWCLLPAYLLLAGGLAHQVYPLTNFRFFTFYYLNIILALLGVHAAIGADSLWSGWRKLVLGAGLLVFLLLAGLGVLAGMDFERLHYMSPLFAGLFLIALLPTAFTARTLPHRWPGRLVLIFLLVFPFLLFFGSGASFSYSMPVYMMPWFALILMLALYLPRPALRLSTLIAFLLVSQFLFVVSYLYFPWRWVENRLAQDYRLENVRGMENLSVDRPTWQFIQESRQIVAEAPPQTNRVMIALYELPGLIYALNGVAPGLPALFETEKEQEKNCLLLTESAQTLDLSRALILLQDEISPTLAPCLPQAGIHLERYQPIGQVFNPYAHKRITVLAPKPEATP